MSGAGFVVDVGTPLPPEVVWARLWDLQRHTEVIPLTTVTTVPAGAALRSGVEFCGRTGLGPLGFDDTMRVTQWRPPTGNDHGLAVVEKTGRVLGGRIRAEVTRDGSGSRIRWRQDLRLPWLPASLRPLESVAARLAAPGYRQVITRLLTS